MVRRMGVCKVTCGGGGGWLVGGGSARCGACFSCVLSNCYVPPVYVPFSIVCSGVCMRRLFAVCVCVSMLFICHYSHVH